MSAVGKIGSALIDVTLVAAVIGLFLFLFKSFFPQLRGSINSGINQASQGAANSAATAVGNAISGAFSGLTDALKTGLSKPASRVGGTLGEAFSGNPDDASYPYIQDLLKPYKDPNATFNDGSGAMGDVGGLLKRWFNLGPIDRSTGLAEPAAGPQTFSDPLSGDFLAPIPLQTFQFDALDYYGPNEVNQ